MVKSIQNKENFPCLVDPTGKEHYLQLGTTILGRSLNSGMIIADERISREHSQIFLEGFHWFIQDLKSTNGTY